jgi:type II secretory ATPase GspE/PulE/Tfp pilus assembly ATPase PilB-like protein
LGDLLTEGGAITRADLEAALAVRDRENVGVVGAGSGHAGSGGAGRPGAERLGDFLRRRGLVSEDALLDALGEQLGLERRPIRRRDVDPAALDRLPAEFVRSERVLPLAVEDGVLVVATDDPGRSRVIEDIRLLSGCEVREVLARGEVIESLAADLYQLTVGELLAGMAADDEAAGRQSLHEIEVMASEPTVVNIVNLVLSSALRDRASDVHLTPFESSSELRCRIDGVLVERDPPPKTLHAALVSRVKIMADMNIAERFIPQDGHFQIQHAGRRVDVRVGTMPTIHGESLVLRLLEKDSEVLSLEQLGLDADRSRQLSALLRKPHGIFLATGPTGSGKTTSLYSILSSIYTKERKILTLEDPVEYELPGVTQIPVKPSRGFTFAAALRAILRQDPDVIMVGEIRDAETAEIAIRAALTGHLVFSTLHTNDASGAVTRLVDMGIETFLIASSLEAVLAQRLTRTICVECREPADPASVRETLIALGADLEQPVFRGAGCERCRSSGYYGRTGIFELLALDAGLRDLILERRAASVIKRYALARMVTLRQDGLLKVAAGITTAEEILRVTAGDDLDLSFGGAIGDGRDPDSTAATRHPDR